MNDQVKKQLERDLVRAEYSAYCSDKGMGDFYMDGNVPVEDGEILTEEDGELITIHRDGSRTTLA